MLTIRCKDCNREVVGHVSQSKCCGCPNMATIKGDKISALDLSRIVMLNSLKEEKKNSIFLLKILLIKKQGVSVK